jgi:preprotein translocase subunit Sec61beta
MAEKQKLQSPSGMAGIVRYDEEDKEALIKLKPIHIVAMALALIILEIILFFMVPV